MSSIISKTWIDHVRNCVKYLHQKTSQEESREIIGERNSRAPPASEVERRNHPQTPKVENTLPPSSKIKYTFTTIQSYPLSLNMSQHCIYMYIYAYISWVLVRMCVCVFACNRFWFYQFSHHVSFYMLHDHWQPFATSPSPCACAAPSSRIIPVHASPNV